MMLLLFASRHIQVKERQMGWHKTDSALQNHNAVAVELVDAERHTNKDNTPRSRHSGE